ncbi:MAG: ABC transporter ATP-binding protein [Candidatus Tectomicrobia bacterium]|nr:ABC transporter ATP-binding protein [Candidatus Tectomicrobia bacterium]
MSQIIFEHISKTYGATAALRDLCLEFPDKMTTAVVGTSGSGKSTLLQHINGLVLPSRGVVKVFEEPIDYARLRQLRLRIGYAVQGSGLFPHLTAKQNITLLARLQKWERPRLEARAEELMRLVNLPLDYAPRYPHELSGGEQQRVGLCRAMMLDPPIFLLDEAFGALDPITRGEVHEEFLRLQRAAPRTVVLVTHDVREALKLGDYLVVLSKGELQQAGPCEEVVASPATEFVRQFLRTQLET